jgi:4'-phosphopantetheinyl transferase EntD
LSLTHTAIVHGAKTMIAELLPASVAAAETFGDLEGVSLFADEEAVVASAAEQRRGAFATGRACARRALGELGLAPTAIRQGERGAPQWPAGVVGSITHCEGYRAAAVAHSREVLSLGIDAEPHDALPKRVLGRIALPQEQAWLHELAEADPTVCWGRLLFSAKEAVYKTWYPLTEKWLNFKDALIAFDAQAGTFDARLQVPGPMVGDGRVERFAGRWLVRDGLVVSAIALTAS